MDTDTQDTYKTILKPSEEVLFKDKNSKFFGYAFPATSESEIKSCLEDLKKRHHAARHWCYAYQTGTTKKDWRANDDGEPNNSAGMPIYGQIQSFGVTNILIVVVRHFGGVKLGVSGLINAYKTTAQMALEASEIVEKTVDIHFRLRFDYKNMNKVMKVIKEQNLNIINQKMEWDCQIEVSIRKKDAEKVHTALSALYEVEVGQL